jgi:hypothetical protein
MLNREDYTLIESLDQNSPKVRVLVSAANNPDMENAARAMLRNLAIREGLDPDNLPVFRRVRQLPPGQLHIGKVLQDDISGPEFNLSEKIITQHTGIFGHNGTGKSFLAMNSALQTIKAGFNVWIFDIEDEYSRLNPLFPDGQLLVLEPEQLKFNIFQPPGDWITSASWLDELSLLLRGAVFLRDGSLNIFHTGITHLINRKSASTGTTNWPSLTEAITFFQGIGYGPKTRSAGFVESLLNRLATLVETFRQTAKVTNSDMLSNLSQRSVIFRLHSLTGIPLQFLVSFLLLWLARFKEGSSDSRPHLVIIEEAHMLASEKSRMDIGESVLCRMFRTARKRSIALILCDQVPSELPPAILGNLACRIAMRLINARCIWSLQSSMGLDKKQTEFITTLEPRQAVAQYTLHPTPFAIEVPQLNFPAKPKQSQLYQQAQEVLSKTIWTEQEDEGQQTMLSTAKISAPDDLAGDVLLVMIRICQEPAESIERRCGTLQMDRAREFRARAELDAKGLISQTEHTIAGKIKFFQPTEKGIAWAQKRKIHVKKFKSGIVHEYLLCHVERCIGLIGPRWRLQRNSSIAKDQGLEPDLLVLEPGGKRIIVEICCNNLDYDSKNILIEAKIPDVDLVVAIAPDKKARHLLEDALKRNSQGLDESWQKPVILLDAGECLADQFDWGAVLANENHGA